MKCFKCQSHLSELNFCSKCFVWWSEQELKFTNYESFLNASPGQIVRGAK